MRLTFGIVLLILLMYLGGSTIVAVRAQPVTHTWHGVGNAQTLRFTMPSGPLPRVLPKPWKFGYQLACTGLEGQHPAGASPDTYMKPTFSFSFNGSQSSGSSMGMTGSDDRGHGHQSFHFENGGTFTLSITARPTCAWTVTAASD